jgi:2-(1,2-epoxy-1,2-dihydrophenyl)acetyl-CoA isomerase
MTTIDTGTDHLLARQDEGVGWITMNRPERRNALSGAMLDALARILEQFDSDEAIGCVVLTGAGGAFSAGGDVKQMAESASPAQREAGDPNSTAPTAPSYDAMVQRQRLNQRATAGRLYSLTKPTIAMLPGPAAGAGLSLALACDLRYAGRGALVTTAFARVALAGDYGGTWFLTRLVGSGRARELYYFSERIGAEEAERMGLVNAVFDDSELEAEVERRARQLARGPAVAYRYMKENLNRAVSGELGECLDLEATHHIHTSTTADHRQAAQAFVDRREPSFRGR